MLHLNTDGFSPSARDAVMVHAPHHAERLHHQTLGSDDLWLGIMSKGQYDNRGALHRVTKFLVNEENGIKLSLSDVHDAVQAINVRREEDFYTPTGVSNGFSKALRLARKNARKDVRWYQKTVVTRWDILVGLIQTNDKTFQLVMTELSNQFEDFSFKKLEAAVLHDVKPEAKAKAHAHV